MHTTYLHQRHHQIYTRSAPSQTKIRLILLCSIQIHIQVLSLATQLLYITSLFLWKIFFTFLFVSGKLSSGWLKSYDSKRWRHYCSGKTFENSCDVTKTFLYMVSIFSHQHTHITNYTKLRRITQKSAFIRGQIPRLIAVFGYLSLHIHNRLLQFFINVTWLPLR